MPAQNESKIPVGAVLVGKYRVIREIGRGGMAAVYEAEQLSLGKKVAVKVLASDLSASTVVIERFFREARAAASVKSPHIVDVYDSGRLDDGRPFITMELLEGESLYDLMARVRLIDPETTVRVITHCAKGLMKAHAAGIVHRDLKPENIFLMKSEEGDEVSKILDFGLAKFYAPLNPDEKAKRLTREGAVFGTPAYMSPEQVKGQGNVDHRADLWALGCMAFECLIGRPVWNMDQGVAMTFASIATGPIPVPSAIRSDLPVAFDAWFKKALQRDPNDRFQSAKELAEALAQAWGVSRGSNSSLGSKPDAVRGLTAQGRASPHDVPGEVLDAIRAPLPQTGSEPRLVSQDSFPLRLVGPSNTELPAIAAPEPAASRSRTSPLRLVISGLFLLASVSAAVFVWARFLKPQVFTPTVTSTLSSAPLTSSSGGNDNPSASDSEPKWASAIADAQKLFAAGDLAGAQTKFKEAQDTAGAPAQVVKAFLDQTKIAAAGTGPCKMVAFARPRLAIGGNVGRPSIAPTATGAIFTWTDDHEQPGRDHAYAVLLDPTGRPITSVRDLTPEAGYVWRPSLIAAGDRTVLLYWDAKGREAGVRARFIDAKGRIAGASVLVGAARPGMFWPSIDKSAMGFFVVWQDDRDKDGDDLFVRKLSPELDTLGPETRLSDYLVPKGHTVGVRLPSVAVAANALVAVYRMERDTQHLIQRMRIPLGAPELATGLEERDKATEAGRKDRELFESKLVNEDKVAADAPAVACGSEGCFIVWHGELGGAFAAMIDPVKGGILWRKKFSDKGGHPALGVNGDGQTAVAYYEAGRVKVAFLSREGVGTPSVFARVTGDHPRAWIAGAKKGEWYVAWEDAETAPAHAEAYAARLTCR